MPARLTVVVGDHDLLALLRARPEVTALPSRQYRSAEEDAALQDLLASPPAFVVLAGEYARTPGGAALVTRLTADPAFASTELIVVEAKAERHDIPSTAAVLADPHPTPADPPSHPVWRERRRAVRIRMAIDVEIQVDGARGRLVDLSPLGAQVVSSAPLKPNQRVRITLPAEPALRLVASVAWVLFELPKDRSAPEYRAGLAFSNPDVAALERFCGRHGPREHPGQTAAGRSA